MAFVRQLLDLHPVDYIFWFDSTTHPDHVLREVHQQILPFSSKLSLANLLLQYQAIIVLDGLAPDDLDHSRWDSCLRALTQATVIVTTTRTNNAVLPFVTVQLPYLSQSDAYSLIASKDVQSVLTSQTTEAIWQQVGGNPHALELTVRETLRGYSLANLNGVVSDLYESVYRELSLKMKMMWLACALLKDSTPSSIMRWLLPDIRSLTPLIEHRIIVRVDGHEMITVTARTFIIQQFAKVDKLGEAFCEYVMGLLTPEPPPLVGELALRLLECDGMSLSCEHQTALLVAAPVDRYDRESLKRWWHQYQERNTNASLDLQVVAAAVMRRLWQDEITHQVLVQCILEAGQAGQFGLQARASYEMAVFHQQRGHYDAAQKTYDRIIALAPIYIDENLLHRIYKQRARLELERGAAQDALQWLRKVPSPDVSLRLLEGEAFLLKGYIDRAETAIMGILSTNLTPTQMANAHALLGRCAYQCGDLDVAQDLFYAALSIFEQHGRDFDIGRLCSNIAALRLSNNHILAPNILAEIAELLQRAIRIQESIADQAGLAATHHNQMLLNQRLTTPD